MNPIEPTEQVSFLPKIELEFTKKNYAKTYSLGNKEETVHLPESSEQTRHCQQWRGLAKEV